MEEDDDDFYSQGSAQAHAGGQAAPSAASRHVVKDDPNVDAAIDENDDEEDEDEDDSDEDDIQIITQRKPGGAPADPAPSSRPSAAIKIEAPPSTHIPAGAPPSSTTPAPTSGAPRSSTPSGRPGHTYPQVNTSTLALDANPILPATGKPLFSTDMDADFAATDKAPWRRPGTDMTDYYNYGFDEGTWAAYCSKQRQLRGEIAQDRKMMEQLQAAMMGGGGGGTGAMPFGGAMPGLDMSGTAGMPSMEQMQQMMQMMGGGMPGMPGMDGMNGVQGQQGGGYQQQGGYGGGRGRGKRW